MNEHDLQITKVTGQQACSELPPSNARGLKAARNAIIQLCPASRAKQPSELSKPLSPCSVTRTHANSYKELSAIVVYQSIRYTYTLPAVAALPGWPAASQTSSLYLAICTNTHHNHYP